MGMYIGQLPPAEIARLKAELAETLIANFCYPRFFDPRTQTLRTRPVDRAKRQEVWLYLSSVDFTSWNHVDLMSADLQHQVERLFILFVQRNRSFFGDQGRKRMPDVRMLINSCAASVVQGLRSHVAGQKQGNQPFGSPRAVISWGSPLVTQQPEPGWEQIAAETMVLQKQVQEARSEVKPGTAGAGEMLSSLINGNGQRSDSSELRDGRDTRDARGFRHSAPLPPQPPAPSQPQPNRPAPSQEPRPAPQQGNHRSSSLPPAARGNEQLRTQVYDNRAAQAPRESAHKSGQLEMQIEAQPTDEMPRTNSQSLRPQDPREERVNTHQPFHQPSVPGRVAAPMNSASSQSRGVMPAAPLAAPAATSQRDSSLAMIGEDDIAIFEQMRHMLIVWLRIEAVKAGLETSGQTPVQLLDSLRQQGTLEETRLQVVSTLLNLANQVIKTGLVSVIDYKQALMFYLMHTKH